MNNEVLDQIIEDIRCSTFHMNDEQAIPIIDEYLVLHPELLNYHDKMWYYKNC